MPFPVQTRFAFRSPAPSGSDRIGQVRGGGTIRNSPALPASPMRVFGRYALVYLLGGSGRYADANGYAQAIVPGDLIVVFPDLAHTYGPGTGEHWDEVHVIFEGPVFDLWRQAGLLDPARPVVSLLPVAGWRARLEEMAFAGVPSTDAARAAEACRLLEMLTEMYAGGSTGREQPAWRAQAEALLSAHLDRDIDLPDIAQQVGMPYETFRRYFARETGTSPARYRAERRLSAACDLLRQTRLPLRQIAELVGFADESAFSHRFKQAKGQTPRQFRQAPSFLPTESNDEASPALTKT